MKIYYTHNTGIKTPQGRNLDYFQLVHVCIDYNTNVSNVDVIFHEYLMDAEEGKPPPAARTIEWSSVSVTDEGRFSEVLAFDNVTTTSKDVITLKGAEEK